MFASPTQAHQSLNKNNLKDMEKKHCPDCEKEVETEVYNDKVEPEVLVCKECKQTVQQ